MKTLMTDTAEIWKDGECVARNISVNVMIPSSFMERLFNSKGVVIVSSNDGIMFSKSSVNPMWRAFCRMIKAITS